MKDNKTFDLEKMDLDQGLKDLQNSRKTVTDALEQVLPEEALRAVDSKLKNVTLQEIIDADAEKLFELNKIDDENIIIEVPELNDPEKEINYLRDFLVFIKKSISFVDDLDLRLAEFNKIMDETSEKLDEFTNAEGDKNIVKLTRTRLESAIKSARDPKSKARFEASLEAFEDSFKLTRLIELYKNLDSRNLHREAITDGSNLYKKYLRASKELKLKADISNMSGFEVKCFGKEYEDQENVFAVIMMKYIGRLTKTRGADINTDGLFAAQVTTNMYLAMNDGLPEEERETFLNAVKTLLGMVK